MVQKFMVGQKVKVVKKVVSWHFDNSNGELAGRGAEWTLDMDKTIGKTFEIIDINKDIGYRLKTDKLTDAQYNYSYPAESLQALEGTQLLFNFME